MRGFLIPAAFVVTAACGTAARGADTPATYTDPKNGFSMQAPDLGTSTTLIVPVTFNGPAAHGFAPNVNVVIQPIKTTRKEFLALSLEQFAELKATVNSQKELTVSGRDAVMMDYQMTVKGNEFHFLALFVVGADKVYIVTATSLPDDFAANEAAFHKCLESFSLPK